MAKLKLAIIVGSLRRDSINRKLAEALAKLGADSFDSTILRIDDLPLYNQDLEASWPESATRLKTEIAAADAVLLVTPEHNRAIPAALKNAIDWASRPYGKSAWASKVVAVTGTSAGASGTLAAQQELRMIMSNLAGVVVGSQVFVTFKDGLIGPDHSVTDEGTRAFLQGFVDNLAKVAGKHAA